VYNTWGYYADIKHDSVKAFAVEIIGSDGGAPVGDVYELNYSKHREAVQRSSFDAKTVDVTFIPTRCEDVTTRTFDVAEYSDHRRSITDRYGGVVSVRYNLSGEDEALLTEILDDFKAQYHEDTVPGDIDDYVREMVKERFHDYGYTKDDMAFTTPAGACAAIEHRIPVYILYPRNRVEQAGSREQISSAIQSGCILGMNQSDKRMYDGRHDEGMEP
jgi:hypothetical protein